LSRFKQHSYVDENRFSAINNAIKKYGFHNFTFTIVDSAKNQENLNLLEESYICLFGSKTSVNGYNIRDGGSRGRQSAVTRIKMSWENHPNFLGLDSKKIVQLYTKDRLSAPKIAKILGCHKKTIYRYLEKEGIKRRTNSESQQTGGFLGFIGIYYRVKHIKPWKRVWNSVIHLNNYCTSLGVFEDPFSAELVYKLVWTEIYS
jgi:hypothetical protein